MPDYPTCNIISNNVLFVNRDETVATEPVTLDQAKQWLKMESISDDNDVISALITNARDWLEKYCGITLVQRDVSTTVEIKNRLELPLGPVDKSTIVVTDSKGDTVDSPVLTGSGIGFILINGYGQFNIDYTAGYETIPAALILAMKQYITYAYEHRGDGLSEDRKDYAYEARRTAFPYKRNLVF